MSGRIGQRLAPGERVVCRLSETAERPDLRRALIALAAVFAAVLFAKALAPYLFPDAGFLIGLVLTVGVFSILFRALDGNDTIDAAVTDQRLLVVTGWNPTLTTEVKPDEIEGVEILRGGLRIWRRGGPPILLVRRRGSAELAVAMAELAGLPPPSLPGRRELTADRVMLASSLATGYAVALACLAFFALLPWTLESDENAHSARLVILTATLPGALLGTLVGLVLARVRFTRAEMRAWIEGSAHHAEAMADGGRSERLARRILAFALRLYGSPGSNDNTGAERHGG